MWLRSGSAEAVAVKPGGARPFGSGNLNVRFLRQSAEQASTLIRPAFGQTSRTRLVVVLDRDSAPGASPHVASSRRGRQFLLLLLALLTAALIASWSAIASACPFCTVISQTLSEDLEEATAAVVAQCESVSAETDGFRMCRMRVTDVIQGDPSLKNSVVEVAVASNRELDREGRFWMVAYGAPPLAWAAPTDVSPAGVSYVRGLGGLPAGGAQRLAYFLSFLQHPDDLVADDAYNEFAKASLEDVAGLKGKLDRQWVVTQLRDPSVPQHRRRLYWTLLSQCGTPADTALFDELVRDRPTEATYEPGLDAAIACFITLGGEEALTRVEGDYLANPEAEYTDTYAAVMAIRVHGEELEVFPRERLAAALRRVLDRPALADLVMADLARWEDWTAIDRVVELFETATEETSFLKLAAARYLKACPWPAGAEALDKLRSIDPTTVQQVESSMMLFPGATFAPAPPADEPDAVAATTVELEEPEVAGRRQNAVVGNSGSGRRLPWFALVALLSGAVVGTLWILARRRAPRKSDAP